MTLPPVPDSRWAASRADLLAALLAGVLVAACMPGPRLAAGAGAAVAAWGALGLGRAMARAFRLDAPAELALVLGLVLLAYAMALPHWLWGADILWTGMGTTALGLLLWRPPRAPGQGAALLAILAAFGFALAWNLEVAQRFAGFASSGTLALWTDVFLHASTIAEMGDPRSLGRGNSTFADLPVLAYHFVSFALPALAVRGVDAVPLATVTGIWLPVGILAMALGVLAAGRALAGMAGGALALLLLAALPDSASQGWGVGFLSFHWLLETSPASGLALGCAMVSLALLARAEGGRGIVLSMLPMLAVSLLRAQIFVWFALPWAVCAVLQSNLVARRWKAPLMAAGAMLAWAGLLWINRAAIAEHGLLGDATRFFRFLRSTEPLSAYAAALDGLDGPWAWPGEAVLALSGFGLIPLVGTLLGLFLLRRRGLATSIDVFPLAALLWAVALMSWAPTPSNGDFTEFRHRGFLVVTLVLQLWVARALVLLLPRLARPMPLALGALAAGLVTWQSGAAWKAPRMEWARSFRHNEVPRPVVEAAAWMRANAGRSDAFALARPDPAAILMDEGALLAGLSGVPSYLARAGLHRMNRPGQVAERETALAAIVAAPSEAEAMARLHAIRVGFYVVTGGQGPDWDPDLTRANFRAEGIAIYAVPPG
ncbi:hypothetical protein [Roseococcus sp. YIM B11640]|uniref:hypothetical protein n=1 Tax=Roseococcus sp. YIM B11640 TaxID=3133973 RepID=UPI003C7E28B2